MNRKQRRVGPLSRLEPMKQCSSISCLSPRKSDGGSLIHDKFQRTDKNKETMKMRETDSLLFPLDQYKLKTPNK